MGSNPSESRTMSRIRTEGVPGGDSNQHIIGHQGSAKVSVAQVVSRTHCAEHVGRDGREGVKVLHTHCRGLDSQ